MKKFDTKKLIDKAGSKCILAGLFFIIAIAMGWPLFGIHLTLPLGIVIGTMFSLMMLVGIIYLIIGIVMFCTACVYQCENNEK